MTNETVLVELAKAFSATARSIQHLLAMSNGNGSPDPKKQGEQPVTREDIKALLETVTRIAHNPRVVHPPKDQATPAASLLKPASSPVKKDKRCGPRAPQFHKDTMRVGLLLACYADTYDLKDAAETAGIPYPSARGKLSWHRGHLEKLRTLPLVDRRSYLVKWFGFPETGHVDASVASRSEVQS